MTQSTRMSLIHTDLQIEGVFTLVPAFEADGKWSKEERRHIKGMLMETKGTLEMITETMTELRATAESVLERLAETAE